MVNQANNILQGKWLGKYNSLTLIKGPITPIFMAIANLLNIPFIIAQDIFYISACLLVIYVLRNYIKNNITKLVIFTILIFNPIIYSTELCRAYRDGIYVALIMYLIGFTFGILLNRKEKKIIMILYYIGLGITIGTIYLCREENIWLFPYLISFLITNIYYNIKEKKLKQRSLLCLMSILIILLMTMTVRFFNYKYYGVFQLNQYWSKEFKEAYGALTRILPENEFERVPVTTDMLEKAYEISPSFKRLEEYFERNQEIWALSEFKYTKKSNGQIEGGYFHWAFMRAVESKGYYKNARMANAIYKRIADEINTACDEEQVDCLKYKRVSNVIRFDINDLFTSFLKCKDTIKYQYEMKDMNIQNEKIISERHEKIKGLFETITLTKVSVQENETSDIDKTKINTLEKIKEIYAKVNPFIFYESIIVSIIVICRAIAKKEIEKIIILIGLAEIYISRIFIITFTSVTMYASALNVMYLSLTYVIQILFSLVANVFFINKLSNDINKGEKYKIWKKKN